MPQSLNAAQLVQALGLEAALSDDGRALTVAGYASLMDEASAKETSPSLRGFRLGTIEGYCRVFTLVSIINVRRGLASGRRLATATARPRDGCHLRVCLYEIDTSELPGLVAREARLRLGTAPYVSDTGAVGAALFCSEYTDGEYLAERCGGSTLAFHEAVGQYYAGKLYRSDILPVPAYVMGCLRAQRQAGPEAMANFLDASFLGDGSTTLRAHLRMELAAEPEDADDTVWPLVELRALLFGGEAT